MSSPTTLKPRSSNEPPLMGADGLEPPTSRV
jgi:hypothetical protein